MRYRTSALSDSRVQEKRSGNSGGAAEEVEAIPFEGDDDDYSPYGGGGGLNVRKRRARAFQRSKCVVICHLVDTTLDAPNCSKPNL